MQHVWDLLYPSAGAQELPFARGRLDVTEVLWMHAAPEPVTVHVRTDDDQLAALGADLKRTGEYPMAKLVTSRGTITRTDGWPREQDLGSPVILPGGEVGILRAWWSSHGRLRMALAARVLQSQMSRQNIWSESRPCGARALACSADRSIRTR